MKVKSSILMVLAVFLVTSFAFAEDEKQPSGYYTTDMWLLVIDVYKPVALDHVVVPGLMTQNQIRSIGADPQCTFLYYSDEYDVAIFGNLLIAVYYRNGYTANIICLGDGVK